MPEKKTAALPRSEVTAERRRKRLFFASAETKDERGRCEGIPNDPSQSELGHATPQPIPRHCPRGTRRRKGNQTVKQRRRQDEQPTRCCCTATAPISPLFLPSSIDIFSPCQIGKRTDADARGSSPFFPPISPLKRESAIGNACSCTGESQSDSEPIQE